jgi:DNA-formamidopyrimidine glycosylase
MPELPEVETIRTSLARLVVGRQVVVSTVYDSPKSFPNDPTAVAHFLHGATITAVERRAKVLLIRLNTNYTLVVHLKMTGQLLFVGEERWGGGHPNDSFLHELPDRLTRVALTFADGAHLYFNDLRKFGWMKLYPTPEVAQLSFMQKVGPEPLDPHTTAAQFITRIRRRNGTTMKAAILDQTTIAGVGNIYADESLWMTQLHPATRVRMVDDEQLAALFAHIRQVLQLSIDKGGSTDRNYVDAEGNKGSYLAFAQVFRREGQPCPRHPDVEIMKIRVAGRGTHICPVCQVKVGE